jgi:hypothetical protein
MIEGTTPSPTPPSPPPAATFAITVVGAMNPAIHHPLWYRFHDMISDAERDEALATPLISTQSFSAFSFGQFGIECDQQHWSLRTSSPSGRQRVLEIAARAFDQFLNDTPVSLITLNNDLHLQTALQDVRPAIVSLFVHRLSGLQGVEAANLRLLVRGPDGGDVNVLVEPSVRSMSELFVGVASSHSTPTEYGHFVLRTLLERFYEPDHQAAVEYGSTILAALSAARG